MPKWLERRWGREALIKTLNTADPEQAHQRARLYSIQADRMFAFIMSKPELTPEEIDALARDWFSTALEVDEEARLSARPGQGVYTSPSGDDEDAVEADSDLLSWLEGEAREAVARNDFSKVRNGVEAMLANAGVAVDAGSLSYRRLANALLRADAEFYRVARARRVGNYAVESLDPLFRFGGAAVTPVAAPVVPKSLPLSAVKDQFVLAKKRDEKWTAHTERTSVPKLKLFVDTLGDPEVDAVTPDMIRDWRDALADMDLANNTIRLHFKTVAAMFNWAKRERKATVDNPTRGLAPAGDDATRDVYSAADLQALFHSPLYTGYGSRNRRGRAGDWLEKDHKFWFPLIALHTGMRVEEIAKLKRKEVLEVEGVWCFDVTKAKTKAGVRVVPIHPRLIDLGLLEHLGKSRHELLWPELEEGSEGLYSQRFVVWWPKFLRQIGIARDGLVFHSFRHTFVSHLEVAGVDTTMIARIVGHKIKNITSGRYGGKLITPQIKLDAFWEVDFGVDLGHLRP